VVRREGGAANIGQESETSRSWPQADGNREKESCGSRLMKGEKAAQEQVMSSRGNSEVGGCGDGGHREPGKEGLPEYFLVAGGLSWHSS